MINQRYGKLVVVKFHSTVKCGNSTTPAWICKCDCGNEKICKQSQLKSGLTKSCGCLHKEIMVKVGEKKRIKLEGQKFNKVLVIKWSKDSKYGGLWECLCDCGNISYHTGYHLRAGNINSCGCSRKGHRTVDSSIKTIYLDYRTGAKSRNLSFEITFDEFKEIVTKNCGYCGASPAIRKRRGNAKVTGVDRMNNKLGYILSNCIPCCKLCNYMKMKLDKDDFIRQVKKIHLYQGKLLRKSALSQIKKYKKNNVD